MQSTELLEQHLQLALPSKVTQFKTPDSQQQDINLFLKRDDLIHSVVCGNKWRKLKYNFANILQQNI